MIKRIALILLVFTGCAILRSQLQPNKGEIIFSHKKHLDVKVKCVRCHGDVEKSTVASDNLMPKEANCMRCHELKKPKPKCPDCHENVEDAIHLTALNLHLKFSHSKHTEKEVECLECHGEIRNSLKTKDDTLPQMSLCRKCHAISVDNCDYCHAIWEDKQLTSIDVALFPSEKPRLSHPKDGVGKLNFRSPGLWRNMHKRLSYGGDAPCTRCHKGDFRPDSHGTNYLTLHGEDAKFTVNTCNVCHGQSDCRECHSQNIVNMEEVHPDETTWTYDFHSPKHHAFAAKRNMLSCASCHTEEDCIACHSPFIRK